MVEKLYLDHNMVPPNLLQGATNDRAFRLYPHCLFKTCNELVDTMHPSRALRLCRICEIPIANSYFWYGLCTGHKHISKKKLIVKRLREIHQLNSDECPAHTQHDHEDVMVR